MPTHMSESVKILLQGQGVQDLSSFAENKVQTSTRNRGPHQGEGRTPDSTVVPNKGVDSKDLVKFGQLLSGGPQRQQALAPRVVGSASQSSPIIAPQFQPNLQALAILSQLLQGG